MLQKTTRISLFIVASCLIALSTAVTGFGQGKDTAADRGFSPGKSYAISDIETVALQSGNMMLNLPLGSLPAGRGSVGGGVMLSYNSKMWDMTAIDGLDISGNPVTRNMLKPSDEGGWRYGYKYYFRIDNANADCANGEMFNGKINLVMPDGGTHVLLPGDGANALSDDNDFSSIYPDGRSSCGGTAVTAGQTVRLFSADGSFLRMEVITDTDTDVNNNRWTLYAPDGTRVVNKPADDTSVSQRIYDRNGNYVDVLENAADSAYSSRRTTHLRDALQRKVVIEYGTGASGVDQDSIHSAGFGGAEVVTRVVWTSITVNKTYDTCGCTAPSPNPRDYYTDFPLSRQFRVVDKIYLPDQVDGDLKYEFGYNADSTSAADAGWGEIDEITLPSLASAAYAYQFDNYTAHSPWRRRRFSPTAFPKRPFLTISNTTARPQRRAMSGRIKEELLPRR